MQSCIVTYRDVAALMAAFLQCDDGTKVLKGCYVLSRGAGADSFMFVAVSIWLQERGFHEFNETRGRDSPVHSSAAIRQNDEGEAGV